MSTAESILNFLKLALKVKRRIRTGWKRCQVEDPESVADHMYGLSLISFLFRDISIDNNRCIKIALVHDIAESLVGDITVHDGIKVDQKHKMEAEAIVKLKGVLGGSLGEELEVLWNEYNSASSPEAKIVKQLDKLEMIVQAGCYEEEQKVDLEDFFNSTKDAFYHEVIASWAKILNEEHKKRKALQTKTRKSLGVILIDIESLADVSSTGFISASPFSGAVEAVTEMLNIGYFVAVLISLDSTKGSFDDRFSWVKNNLGEKFMSRIVVSQDKTLITGNVLITNYSISLDNSLQKPTWVHIHFSPCSDPKQNGCAKNFLKNWSNWSIVLAPYLL
eukprot:TRINITY_DN15531_c0_g1_i1.p1 TRINITY_DN15531_c0_g1~~TRINITY_DN15531_c0_g1_i1.p1  ORF type:complete len:334 (+),score=40.39 TRINITY_DN15531_c0_g1_i1:41-1042(+)